METDDRRAKYETARLRARKVSKILANNNVTLGEALSLASELFQVLSIMGETNITLAKSLAYLAVKLQDTDLDKMSMELYYNGIFDKHQLSITGPKASSFANGDERHNSNIQDKEP